MSKKLNYNEMLEKLLDNYYSYNKKESSFIKKALKISKERFALKTGLKFLNKNSKEEFGSELISKAFWYSKKKHLKQKRVSGEPYFIHPYNTALYLTQLKMDAQSIAAALLHDVVEDTETAVKEIKTVFGKEVASLVESLTKLRQIVTISDRKEYNVALQKILLATTKDVRVLLIKLADKYHNLKTLQFLPKQKQIMIASHALEFYVPLAKKLGLHDLKDDFEEICFKIIKPKIYVKIRNRLKTSTKLKEDEMNLMIKTLEKKLSKAELKVDFTKYRRTTYSTFKKMTQNFKSFTEVQDSVVLIALTDTKEQCYEFLGILHNTFSPIPLKFRDHMSISQLDLYKSIHTTVLGPKHSPIKIYIRTKEMQSLINKGVAELLRESEIDKNVFRKNLSLLNNLMSINIDELSTESFIDSLKTDYLKDRILVFTPQGKITELPKDASVIDFAYAVDSKTGDRLKKAKVNGKNVPIWQKLGNGDLVEVIAGKNIKVSKFWNNFAISAKAREEIQKHLRRKKEKKQRMPLVSIEFRAFDRVGLIKDFADAIVEANANIFSAEIKSSYESRIGKNSFTIELSDPIKLEQLIKRIKKIKGVVDVKSRFIE
ncbi:MAG: hypothetical protein COT90_00325 [Candidatus Diapherotrites archaeon CG10_big_fil_rev_8_21_14_0_10_31_34]|nr:MAG: hypothetical protein COT90_00325 [Candidatus Diapherotrites archaeon CG10_big_fil_rev_8_21_14_0_10_31_34]